MDGLDNKDNFSAICNYVKAESHGQGQFVGHCPAHEDKKKSLSLRMDGQKLLMECHAGCTFGEILNSLNSNGVIEKPRAVNLFEELWNSAYPIEKEQSLIGRTYLETRGLKLYANKEVRFHPSQKTKGQMGYWPCLLFAIRDKNNCLIGVQRIFLDHNCKKAFSDNKRVLGKMSGGAIQFGDPVDKLAIAEGPETAMSLAECIDIPVWSVVSASNMAKFVPPPGVTELLIFSDNDIGHQKGQKAADSCARLNSKIDSYVFLPETTGIQCTNFDYNDAYVDPDLGPAYIKNQIKQKKAVKKDPILHVEEYRFHDIVEVMNCNYGKWEWLVDEMIQTSGMSLFVGKPKCGKSTLVRQLIVAAAQGGYWLNRKVRKTNVLYIAYEEVMLKIQEHFKAMTIDRMENVYIHSGIAPKIDITKFSGMVTEKQIGLIVIDPLINLLNVKDLNKYEEVYKVLTPMIEFCRVHKCSIVGLHHTKKGVDDDPDAILGSTALRGAVDATLLMRRTEHERVIMTEQRVGMPFENTCLDYDPDSEMLTLGDSEWVRELKAFSAEALIFLKTGPQLQGEILKTVKGRTEKKIYYLRDMAKRNLIERVGEGGKKSPYSWKLKDSPFRN